MQWPSLILILVLALDLAQCTWMKFSVLAERLTLLIAVKALPSAVLLSTHMQEYDVKVWKNDVAYYWQTGGNCATVQCRVYTYVFNFYS